MPMMDKVAPPIKQAARTRLFEALDQPTMASRVALTVEIR
jgi:hypothetical protein